MRSWVNRSFTYILLIVTVSASGVLTANLWAQAIFGSIYGQITDSTGAVVTGATVLVQDVTKGTSVQVTTNSAGEYSVEHLIPDVYNVTVSAPGFRGAENKDIRVSADTAAKLDLSLQVGSNTESVTVTTEIPQLKTDRADVGLVLDQQTVSDLPNLNRNFASLELLVPGTQAMGWSQNSAEDPQGSPTVQINGQHFSGVAYQLDGAANTDPILGQIVINPPLDAVTEAKITTQNFDAQFGTAVAAVVTAQTKSGTNGFHGDLFDYRLTDATQAKNPFNQFSRDALTHRFIPATKRNQFGGSVGGPIVKNKAFFFFDYQGTRQNGGGSARATVPTLLVRNSCIAAVTTGTGGCDLSEFLASTSRGPSAGQIYNPRAGSTAFVGNIIPANLVSKQAVALLQLLPAPNAANPDPTQSNYTAGGTGSLKQNQFDARVDDQVSERTHAFGRYSFFSNKNSAPTIFGPAGGQALGTNFGGTAVGRNQSAIAGMDIAISPTLLTDFRLGYLRYHVKTSKYDGTQNLATMVGIPGLNLGDTFTSGAPGFFTNNDGISNFGSALDTNQCNCPLLETEDQYQLVNNWTKIVGTHSIKFGGDFIYGRNLRVPSDRNRAGELHFESSDTQSLTSGGGIGLATFLLGDVTNFQRYVSVSTNAKESQDRIFSYVQDTWRATSKLTINYGLRWEIYVPESVNGKGNGGFADIKSGQIRVAGYGGFNDRMNVGTDFKTLAPRLGIAYQLNPKTVIRSGYGRSFDIGVFGSIFGHVLTQNLPVLANQSLTNSGIGTSAFNLSTGPSAAVFPSVPSNGLIPFPDGVNLRIRDDPNRFPTVDSWNLAVQRQLTSSSTVTVAYVGNKGTHTFSGDGQTTDPNEPAPCLPGSETITGQQICWDPSAPSTAGPTTSNKNFVKPLYARYPAHITQGLNYYHNAFDTRFNALQVSFAQRFSHGLQLNANYAYQKGYNYGGEEVNKAANYGRFDDLRNSQLTVFGNYDLPFGKGREFASNIPTWLNYVIGGYSLSTSLDWASGLPFSVGYNECGSDVPAGPCRPNTGTGSLNVSLTGFDPATHTRRYFTPPGLGSVFTRPGLDHFGTSQRNSFTGPGLFNDDLAFFKSFPIHESVVLQFRMDAFNAFNHINPGNPNTCIDCGTGSGGVINGMAIGTTPRQLQFSLTLKF